jgi:hypothetical protein
VLEDEKKKEKKEGTKKRNKERYIMEAVFPRTGPATKFIRFRPEPIGTCQNRQPDTVTEFLAFSGWLRPETASFPRVFAGNSRNTTSEFIVVGN